MADTEKPVYPLTQTQRSKLDRENAAKLAGQTRDTVRCPVCHTVMPESEFINHLQAEAMPK